MSSVVTEGSTFDDGSPIKGSPLMRHTDDGLRMDTRGMKYKDGSPMGVNLKLEGEGKDVVYTSDASDIMELGYGDDIANAGGGDDYMDGGYGNDIMRGGYGDDVMRGGKGADVMIGGYGEDTYIIKGDKEHGAYGKDSDLHFDHHGKVIYDKIVDFTPGEDIIVLQDMKVNGVGEVHYDKGTGEIWLNDYDPVTKDYSSKHVIAKIDPYLDVHEHNQGDGNWTLL